MTSIGRSLTPNPTPTFFSDISYQMQNKMRNLEEPVCFVFKVLTHCFVRNCHRRMSACVTGVSLPSFQPFASFNRILLSKLCIYLSPSVLCVFCVVSNNKIRTCIRLILMSRLFTVIQMNCELILTFRSQHIKIIICHPFAQFRIKFRNKYNWIKYCE